MVNVLTKAFGGGRIIIDDDLIQEGGQFILAKLKPIRSKKLTKK